MTILRKVISLVAVSLTLSSCGKKDNPTPNNPANPNVKVDVYAQFREAVTVSSSLESTPPSLEICSRPFDRFDHELFILYAANLTQKNKYNFFSVQFSDSDKGKCLKSTLAKEPSRAQSYSTQSVCFRLGVKFNSYCISD
jgi:hypothetical protein